MLKQHTARNCYGEITSELALRATGGREEERRSVTSIEELVKAISESKSNGHITIEAGSAAAQLQLDWFVKGRASKKLKIQRG
jgi:hypothetical protein